MFVITLDDMLKCTMLGRYGYWSGVSYSSNPPRTQALSAPEAWKTCSGRLIDPKAFEPTGKTSFQAPLPVPSGVKVQIDMLFKLIDSVMKGDAQPAKPE